MNPFPAPWRLDTDHWLCRISPIPTVAWHGELRPGWMEAVRRLVDHELVIVMDGACRIEVAGRSHELGRGSWIIIPPDTPHSTVASPDEPLRRFCIHFDWVHGQRQHIGRRWVFAPESLQESAILRPPDFIPPGQLAGTVELLLIDDTLRRLTDAWAAGTGPQHAATRGILLELLILLLTPATQSQSVDPDRDLAAQVRVLLEDPTLTHDDSIQTAMATLGRSYAHLCRVFRRHHGMTPGRYINMLRIERAKRHLTEGDISIGDTAVAVGFNSPQYFTRTFRRFTGMSPREFRTEWLARQP